MLDKLRSLNMRKVMAATCWPFAPGGADGCHQSERGGPQHAERAFGRYASDQVVDAVLNYINEHYSEALTLDALAEHFFISKYHLLRKFEAQVGTTVHRYILQKRLLNAKQLLAGGLAPSEVCTYCGFGDYANFYRAFRAEYGTTPRQYVQSLRG